MGPAPTPKGGQMLAKDAISDPGLVVAALQQEGVRFDPQGECFSVLDVIAWRKRTRYPSAELQRLLRRHPELEEKLSYTQFPGRRQNQTPTLALREFGYLCRLLASRSRPVRPPETKPTPPLVAIVASRQPPAASTRPAPYGWRWEEESQLYCPIHAELQTVRYVRQLRAFGTKLSEIAAQLSRDGIRPREEPWTAALLEEMLVTPHEELMREHDAFWKHWRSTRRPRKAKTAEEAR